MTQFNWDTFSNEELARLIRNGSVTAGFDTDFNRELVEESARRIERAAQIEAELDAVLERERTELIEWSARVNEQFKHRLQTQLELDTARADIVRYQDKHVALLDRLEALVAELQDHEVSDNPYILHGEELKRATESRIAGRP